MHNVLSTQNLNRAACVEIKSGKGAVANSISVGINKFNKFLGNAGHKHRKFARVFFKRTNFRRRSRPRVGDGSLERKEKYFGHNLIFCSSSFRVLFLSLPYGKY